MRNRAKCKLCKDIIESFHRHDYVTCKCGEISIDGGLDYCKVAARDWDNFIRIDDEGNEIIPKVVDKTEEEQEKWVDEAISVIDKPAPPSRADLLLELDEMIKRYDALPNHEKYRNVTETDLHYVVLLLSAIFRAS